MDQPNLYLKRVAFWCSIVVSRGGTQMLLSKFPDEFNHLIDGDFCDENGFTGHLPETPGIYACHVNLNWKYDEPEFSVREFIQTGTVIDSVEYVNMHDATAFSNFLSDNAVKKTQFLSKPESHCGGLKQPSATSQRPPVPGGSSGNVDDSTTNREKAQRLLKAKQLLEKIVCTEGEDEGLILVSNEAPTTYSERLGCFVYDHLHFSELGDALIELYGIVTGRGE